MADGAINIDFIINDKSSGYFEGVKQKASDTGNKAYENMSKPFDKKVVAKLDAEAKKQGIDNFRSMLNKLPKEQQTQLLAKAQKGQIIDFEELLRKIPSKVATEAKLNDNASTGLRNIQKEAKTTESRFSILKQTMIGAMAANVISAGVGAITTGLKGAVAAGMEFNKEQDTMKTVWHSLTEEAPNDGKVLIDYINQMSQHSIYAADSINHMAQSFYHVHSNVDETKRWTNSFIALGSTMHMTNEQLSESGEQFAKIVAGGKASQEDLNVMINRFPMFGEAVQKATGKSMAELQALSSKGQLTAEAFTKALDYLGEKYKGGTAEAMTSMQGMSMYLKSRLSMLSGDVMKSSFNMSKSATAALQRITSDKAMENYAKAISSALSVALTWVSKLIVYITDHAKDITNIIGSIVKIGGELAGGAWSVFAGTIKTIGAAFGGLSGNGKKSGDALNGVANALQAIASHQGAIKMIGGLIATAFGVKKLSNFVRGVKEVNATLGITSGISSFIHQTKLAGGVLKLMQFKFVQVGKAMKAFAASTKIATAAQWALDVAMNANPIGLIVIAIAAVIGALFLLYKNFKPFREFVNGFMKSAGKVFQSFGKAVGSAMNAAGKELGKFGRSVAKFIGSIGKWFGSVGKSVSSAMSTVGKEIKKGINSYVKAFQTFWKGIYNLFKAYVYLVVGIFVILGSLLLKALKPILDPVVKFFQNVFKTIGQVIDSSVKAWQKTVDSVMNTISSIFKSVWNGIVSFFKPIIKSISDAIDSTLKTISNTWNSTWNAISSFFSGLWNGISSAAKTGMKVISDVINSVTKSISSTWSSVWNGVSSFFNGIWGGITGAASSAMNGLHNSISGPLNAISNIWKSTWDGISSFFGGIWDGITSKVKGAMDTIKSVINVGKDAVSGIKNALPKFAHGGIVQANDQLVMVNDGVGSDWKELIKLPSGELTMARDKNAVLPLPVGTRIYSGEDTKKIMDKNGIKQYAAGGHVGDVSFPDNDDLEKFNLHEHFAMMAKQAKAALGQTFAINPLSNNRQQSMQSQIVGGGNVDLSGDTKVVLNVDGQTFAQQIYPKIKMIQNMDIQLTGQAKGAIYGR